VTRKAHRIKLCWGIESGECPNLLFQEPNLKQDLEFDVERSGWPELLGRSLPREIKPLDQFSISVSGCPNGCSRPQIADFGLLQVRHPEVSREACTGCEECVQACREEAIEMLDGMARIDSESCLSCGVCIRTCPEGALSSKNEGYRVQIGGKLGRHPRLADELPGIHARDQMLKILKQCLELHQRSYRPGRRFGQVVAEHGVEELQV